ncbi:MAG: hypothetical protein L6R39_000836 [Caloplaca ligustica]|nr:MAG: hypothetical protein L6R39_000836 [Caloplaca ligustica]
MVICRPATSSSLSTPSVNSTNATLSVTSIPPDFNVDLEFALPFGYPPEACYLNIIAALYQIALGDFTKEMPVTSYRTTRFTSPVIKIQSPRSEAIRRDYVVWGLFLMSFYIHKTSRFTLSFYGLQRNGNEVGGIGMGGALRTGLSLAPYMDRSITIEYDYFSDDDLGKGAIFMTIIKALTDAAPTPAVTPIRGTWISFLHTESCLFVVTATDSGRSMTPPFFTYEDLFIVLARVAEKFVHHNRYSPLSMKISIDGTEVAHAAFTRRVALDNGDSSATMRM